MTTNNSSTALANRGDSDTQVTARMIESLVLKGDISGMAPHDRAAYYTSLCESLGLNPATQPIAYLQLNGKLVPYFLRSATDQLAAIHRLNRCITDGPKVIDVGGQKLVYAVCEARHPNGRIETATGMVPLPGNGAEAICNAFLKTETKARRRATLSILGLGLLDESEIDTIQGAQRMEVGEPVLARVPRVARVQGDALEASSDDEPDAVTTLHVDLDALGRTATVWQTAAVWCRYRAAIEALGDADVTQEAQGACVDGVFAQGEYRKVSAAEWREVVAVTEAASQHPVLAEYLADVTSAACATGSHVADVWSLHKAALSKLPKDVSALAWKAACRRVGELEPGAKQPQVWLRDELSRRTPPPEPPKGGGKPTPAANDVAAQGDAHEAAAVSGSVASDYHREQAKLLVALHHLKACESSVHVARHYAVHVDELPTPARVAYRESAATYLRGRYPRAVSSIERAYALLDEARDARDGDERVRRVA